MRGDSARGVSDVVSFTLVFSTIIFMIGVVTVTGIGTLEDVQEGTETNVAEETMQNYAASLAEHRRTSAPRRSTTIKLQGHQLELRNPDLTYFIDGSPTTIRTGSLVRTTDTDAELVYQSGGLYRVQDGGAVVVRDPPFRCGADTAHLAITVVEAEDGAIGISSDNRVTLESERMSQQITAQDANTVTIDASSTGNTEAWNKGLEGDWTAVPGPADLYRCNVDRVVVHETVVSIDVVN